MGKRFFTVKEANDLIPFLSQRVPELLSTYRDMRAGSEKSAPDPQDILALGGMPVHPGRFHLMCRLQTLAAEIGARGCQIKDLEMGLVDFPTIWEGREVYLCWKLGEPEVSFWHEIDAGFAGRQPLRNARKSGS